MKTFSVVSFVNEFRISKITYLRSLVASQTLYSKINLSRVCYLSTFHKKKEKVRKAYTLYEVALIVLLVKMENNCTYRKVYSILTKWFTSPQRI